MIWGVDPALRRLALFGVAGHAHLARVIVVPRSTRSFELQAMRSRLEAELAPGDLVFCEEPVVAGARNLRTTIGIAETVGMVLSVPQDVYLVPVSTWKKSTVGRGNVDKAGVSEWLREEYEAYFSTCDGDQDLTDAAAIAVYGSSIAHRSAMDSGSRSPLRGDLL